MAKVGVAYGGEGIGISLWIIAAIIVLAVVGAVKLLNENKVAQLG